MGPRARRRLTIGAIGLGVVAAATAVFFVTRPPGHSTTTSGGGGGVYLRWPITEKLTFGMTKQQVQRLVGKPTMTVRDETGLNCWQYRVNKTYRGFNKQNTLDAVRVCFFSGTYSVAHYEFNGKWDYHPEKIRV